MIVRPEIAPAWLRILARERRFGGTLAAERAAMVGQLITAIEAGEPINLVAPRSTKAAAHGRQSPTTAGYLLGLIRNRFNNRDAGDWHEFIALGALAVDIEAALAQS